jgi:hypothetical protein
MVMFSLHYLATAKHCQKKTALIATLAVAAALAALSSTNCLDTCLQAHRAQSLSLAK